MIGQWNNGTGRRKSSVARVFMKRGTGVITVNGKRLHALAHFAAPLPAKILRRPVDNVAAQANALVSAIDAVLSGI